MIEACLIDSREPTWIQHLTFGGVPTSVVMLETGDVQAITDDGHMLLIERKTPEDLLNTLRDERLFPQAARMSQIRYEEQLGGSVTTYPYLVITGDLRNVHGKVATDDRGPTGWEWSAVQGALLSIQEMGVFVTFCNGDADFEDCVLRLGARARKEEIKLLPPRVPVILGPGSSFLAGLPGIGTERVTELMKWCENIPAHALAGITDLEIQAPIPAGVRKRIRAMLGLRDKQIIDLWINGQGDEVFKVLEKVGA